MLLHDERQRLAAPPAWPARRLRGHVEAPLAVVFGEHAVPSEIRPRPRAPRSHGSALRLGIGELAGPLAGGWLGGAGADKDVTTRRMAHGSLYPRRVHAQASTSRRARAAPAAAISSSARSPSVGITLTAPTASSSTTTSRPARRGVESRRLHTVVGGEPAYEQSADAAAGEQRRERRAIGGSRLPAGVRVLLGARSLGDDLRARRQPKRRVQRRSRRALHAVPGPGAAILRE